MILDELDPAVLEQLTERERQELIAASEGLQGSALQTHMASVHPTMRAPAPQRLPRLNLEPGQMFSYSTQGPGRFHPDTDIKVETPTGGTVYAPGNAQNISVVQGPAGPTEAEQQAARNEEAQRQAFTQMMSGIPLKNFKDAETATKMAILFNADRQYRALLAKNVPVNEAAMRVAPMYAAAGVPTAGVSRMASSFSPKVMDIGGVGYQINPMTGEAVAVTPPRGVSPDVQARLDMDRDRLALQRELAQKKAAPVSAAARSRIKMAEKEIAALQKAAPTQVIPPSTHWYGDNPGNQADIDRYRQAIEAKQREIDRIGGGAETLSEAVAESEPETEGEEPSTVLEAKPLDRVTAQKILKEAGGDPKKATQIARQRGYKV